jgi:hypothetical protein
MYRSAIQRNNASIEGSKKRTVDRTLRTGNSRPSGTSAGGPSTQPFSVRPWNGTETRLPVPASASAGSR